MKKGRPSSESYGTLFRKKFRAFEYAVFADHEGKLYADFVFGPIQRCFDDKKYSDFCYEMTELLNGEFGICIP